MRPKAEIRERLKQLRKQYAESEKNPIHGDPLDYLTTSFKRKEQVEREIAWMDEIAILEWVLEEKPHLLTSWMRER